MFRDDLLNGKRVLITGGGSGLGKSIGRRYLELGADLFICGRRQNVLEETAAEFEAAFGTGRVGYMSCDVRDPDRVDAMIQSAWSAGPIDILLNNAAGNFIARTETLSPRAVDAVVDIVLKGSAYVTLACGKKWITARNHAVVLSIVTTYAWTGSPYVVPSAMAKAGVLAMTRSLAAEWGPKGIRLNAVAPGPFPTKGAWERLVPRADLAERFETGNPMGRPGEHIELANLCVYLVADESAYVNGDVVTIDGGRWVKAAGTFSFLEELTDAEWDSMRPRRD
jgi:NAD(P)-dependent dehydrogenase (short-subunit alcohol dehydrogenase family)